MNTISSKTNSPASFKKGKFAAGALACHLCIRTLTVTENRKKREENKEMAGPHTQSRFLQSCWAQEIS